MLTPLSSSAHLLSPFHKSLFLRMGVVFPGSFSSSRMEAAVRSDCILLLEPTPFPAIRLFCFFPPAWPAEPGSTLSLLLLRTLSPLDSGSNYRNRGSGVASSAGDSPFTFPFFLRFLATLLGVGVEEAEETREEGFLESVSWRATGEWPARLFLFSSASEMSSRFFNWIF